jgi:hypothetical protein
MTTEIDSIDRGDNAPEIDCSRGDMCLSGRVLGRIPDSPDAKRQTPPDVFVVSATAARESGWRERDLLVLINGKR